eukprot:6488455-Amphidinium_carterae.1
MYQYVVECLGIEDISSRLLLIDIVNSLWSSNSSAAEELQVQQRQSYFRLVAGFFCYSSP